MITALSFMTYDAQAQNEQKMDTISQLEAQKEQVVLEEKEALKVEVLAINARLEKGELTKEDAEVLKKEAAKEHARNIEDKLAILQSKIDLLERNDGEIEEDSVFGIFIGDGKFVLGKEKDQEEIVYDRRTTSDLVLGIGFNNALSDGRSLNDSPYKIGGSRFFELGVAWKTRVFDNSNFLRLKYGFSFQFNGLKLDDNQYFVENGDQTILETFPINLDKSKFRMDHLVFSGSF